VECAVVRKHFVNMVNKRLVILGVAVLPYLDMGKLQQVREYVL
jgi:hypothetical protein